MKPEGYDRTKLSLALQLCEAVEEQSLQEVWKLLHCAGADPNILIPEKGISPFHLVIGSDCNSFAEEVTRVFLQYNGNPNVRSEDGLTPVHVAAVWGRTALLVLLLSCGGDPWMRDTDHGLTPLHLALKEKHLETALVLQRYQLKDRRNRYSEGHIPPRFNINLESIVVNAGEMQAEYVLSPQDNVSPVLMSPVQGLNKVNRCNWNIEPLQTHEYVRQWCHKEFTPHQATSTPTQIKPLNHFNIANQLPAQVRGDCELDEDERTPNITSTKEMTPKNVNYGTDSASSVNTPLSKNLLKSSTDVRKKLFMELRKRFNGLKQSFDVSKDDMNKTNNFERKRNVGYFGRRSIVKTDKAKLGNIESESSSKIIMKISSSSAGGNLSFQRSQMVGFGNQASISNPNADCEAKSSLENSPTDEVDALPLDGSADTSVEWIASQSCFSEQHSPDSTNSQLYFTCDEGSASDAIINALPFEKTVSSFPDNRSFCTPPHVNEQVPQRPPRRKELKAMNSTMGEMPSNAQSSVSFGTIISEEYLYTDDEAGVVLIENRLLTKPVDVPSPSDTESIVSVPHSVNSDAPTATSDVSTIPASFSYDTVTLRKELVAFGEVVGPITSTTKKVYLRRLYKLKKSNSLPSSITIAPEYPGELQRVLRSQDWEIEIMTFSKLETVMSTPFENPDTNRRWREGVAKSSFNYLLLDPRLSCNLPANVTVHDFKTWRQFISAVFYVGKGKRSRPYAHLYQAVHSWNKGEKLKNTNAKIQRILDIWREGHGVVCLHVFQNIIPVEAFTREAAMLDAIGTNNLVNMKGGEYYGPAATWRTRQKRQLGVYLLYRAMRIFLCEGERQLRPTDID